MKRNAVLLAFLVALGISQHPEDAGTYVAIGVLTWLAGYWLTRRAYRRIAADYDRTLAVRLRRLALEEQLRRAEGRDGP